jgi:hypothetical protein
VDYLTLLELFGPFNHLINSIKNVAGIKSKKGAILFYSSHKIQYRYDLTLGSAFSLTSEIKNELISKTKTPFDLGPVLDAFYATFPDHENYSEVLIKQGNRTILNLPFLLQNTKQEQVIIQFEKQISDQDLDRLFPVVGMRGNAIHHNRNKMEIPVEIMLDHAYSWEQFDSFNIRDIPYNTFVDFGVISFHKMLSNNILNALKTIKEKRKITSSDRLLLQQISHVFKRFEYDPEIRSEFSELFTTDKPRNIQFKEFMGKVKDFEIRGIKILRPHKINVNMTWQLEGKELTLSAKMFVDLEKLRKIVKYLVEDVEKLIK